MSKEKGFSLIELIITVAIIGIIAAIAIPNLQKARRTANETSAIGSLKTCRNAQVSYNWNNQTYGSLAQLHAANFIDETISNSSITNAKSGFYYTNGEGATTISFNMQATRAATSSGDRRFNVIEDGVIRFDTNNLDTPLVRNAGLPLGTAVPS